MFILLPFISWIFFITLTILTFFGFFGACYIYLITSCIIIGYAHMVDFGAKREIMNNLHILPLEMKKYASFLMFPFASKILSIILNSIRWTGIILIIAILMSDEINAYFAVIPTVIFFLSGSLSVNLDPIFFLSYAIRNGKSVFIEELDMLQYYFSIINGK